MAEKKKDPARVQLKNVRLSFAAIYRPKGFGGGRSEDNGEPKYSANFLIDPESREGEVNIRKMEDAIDHVLDTTDWGGKTPKFKGDKLPLRDGDDRDYDGYEGMMYVAASNGKKPRILDLDKLDVSEGDDGAPYSGCYVDAIVRVWGQNNKFGKRINASLEGIRFRDDGDAFGAAPLDPDEFDDDDDRGTSRSSRSRDKDDDDRGGRGGRGGRGRSRDKDDNDGDDDRRSRRRGRDDDDDDDDRDERRSRRSRDKDDDGDDDRSSSRRRGRDEDDGNDDRGNRRRSRDKNDDGDGDDHRSRRSRGRDDDDGDDDRDERRSRRSRDDDDRGSRRGGGRRSRDDDDLA